MIIIVNKGKPCERMWKNYFLFPAPQRRIGLVKHREAGILKTLLSNLHSRVLG